MSRLFGLENAKSSRWMWRCPPHGKSCLRAELDKRSQSTSARTPPMRLIGSWWTALRDLNRRDPTLTGSLTLAKFKYGALFYQQIPARTRHKRLRAYGYRPGRETVQRFNDSVLDLPHVVECHMMAGDCDFLLRVVATTSMSIVASRPRSLPASPPCKV